MKTSRRRSGRLVRSQTDNITRAPLKWTPKTWPSTRRLTLSLLAYGKRHGFARDRNLSSSICLSAVNFHQSSKLRTRLPDTGQVAVDTNSNSLWRPRSKKARVRYSEPAVLMQPAPRPGAGPVSASLCQRPTAARSLAKNLSQVEGWPAHKGGFTVVTLLFTLKLTRGFAPTTVQLSHLELSAFVGREGDVVVVSLV